MRVFARRQARAPARDYRTAVPVQRQEGISYYILHITYHTRHIPYYILLQVTFFGLVCGALLLDWFVGLFCGVCTTSFADEQVEGVRYVYGSFLICITIHRCFFIFTHS